MSTSPNKRHLKEGDVKKTASQEPASKKTKSLHDKMTVCWVIGPRSGSDHFATRLSVLWENDHLSDCIVACGDKEWKCHSAVLYASSGYFRKSLLFPSKGVQKRVELDYEFSPVLNRVLKFLYTGQLSVSTNSGFFRPLLTIYKVADYLDIKEIMEMIPVLLKLAFYKFYRFRGFTEKPDIPPIPSHFQLVPENSEEISTRGSPGCAKCGKIGAENAIIHSAARCIASRWFPDDFSHALKIIYELPDNTTTTKLRTLMVRIATQVWSSEVEWSLRLQESFAGWLDSLTYNVGDSDFMKRFLEITVVEAGKPSPATAALRSGACHLGYF